jgi:hypothetical protein
MESSMTASAKLVKIEMFFVETTLALCAICWVTCEVMLLYCNTVLVLVSRM